MQIKQLETQLEDEQAEKQKLIREKRDTERQIAELINQAPKRDRESEKRLLKDIKRYKALLKDTQDALESVKQDTTTRNIAKQLRSQLEDLEAERGQYINLLFPNRPTSTLVKRTNFQSLVHFCFFLLISNCWFCFSSC